MTRAMQCIVVVYGSVEEQVLEGGQQWNETGCVVGSGADDRGAVGALEVRLHHLIVLAVTQRHRA